VTLWRDRVLTVAIVAAVAAMPAFGAAWDPLALGLWLTMTVVILVLLHRPLAALPAAILALAGALAGAFYISLLPAASASDAAGLRFALAAFAASALLWRVLERLSAEGRGRAVDLAVPLLFGLWLICLWEFEIGRAHV